MTKVLTEQHHQVIDVSNQRVQRLQWHILDDIFIVTSRLVLDQPLQDIFFAGQLAYSESQSKHTRDINYENKRTLSVQ